MKGCGFQTIVQRCGAPWLLERASSCVKCTTDVRPVGARQQQHRPEITLERWAGVAGSRLWIVKRHRLRAAHQSQAIKICERGTRVELRRVSVVGNTDAFTACQVRRDSLSYRGCRRGWRRQRVAAARARRWCRQGDRLLLYAAVCKSEGLTPVKPSTKSDGAISSQRVAQQYAGLRARCVSLLTVAAKRMPHTHGRWPITRSVRAR